ncbi:LysE family translocator [Thalassotalea euphylliae]|uniref:LysE family translocator n=1 Tax=Thalassotalea euphylliae TaxID=1655234 RepID=UPI00362A5D3E
MIDTSILPVFFTAIIFLAISPGPDLVLISTYSATKGVRAGLMIAIGVFGAGVLQTILVALGLGQLMQTAPVFAYAIKIAGALYLSYLGIKMLRNWFDNNNEIKPEKQMDNVGYVKLISRGFFNNLLNPKALLFFSLFLPQFTSNVGNLSLQTIALGLILSTFVMLINIGFAVAFSSFGQIMGSKLKLGRHIDGLLGIIFIGLAARLAASK